MDQFTTMEAPTATELECLLGELARARAAQDAKLAEVENLEVELAATELAGRLEAAEDTLRQQTAQVKMMEGVVREYAERLYEETGQAKPVNGIQIRVTRELSYIPFVALAWCKEHAKALVVETLDVKHFEKVAVVLEAPVAVCEVPRAAIAKDLSALL
jgi:hypothetical protein